jgi:hypothetical protein
VALAPRGRDRFLEEIRMKNFESCLEILKDRIAPTVFFVTMTADSVPGSLRDALSKADGNAGKDTIEFHLPAPPAHGASVITLTGGQLTSDGDVTIVGPGAGKPSARIRQPALMWEIPTYPGKPTIMQK